MPTLAENRQIWEHWYDWSRAGDEWSGAWGGATVQWHRTLWPRLRSWLPAGTVLEIAPGFGRWTQFLARECDRLIVVDLAARCIDACHRRFADLAHLEYHVNDGRSLAMVEDGTIDLAFSFDSLVHAQREVLEAYLEQLAGKLAPDGVAFLHHSNLGAYAGVDRWLARLPGGARLQRWLGWDEVVRHRRTTCVSAEWARGFAARVGLRCLVQELLPWGSARYIDAVSVFTPAGSSRRGCGRTVRHSGFAAEIADSARLARLYG